MTDLHSPRLSPAELEEFHARGYIRLGHVAAPAEIEDLCQRIDQIMLGEVHYDNTVSYTHLTLPTILLV